VTYDVRIHELALEAEIANDKSTDPDKLNMELGFSAPRGSIQHEKWSVLDHPDSETAYSETPDDEEPNEQEKQTLRRGMLRKQNLISFRTDTIFSWREPPDCLLAGRCD
jgi:hypothetical protein